MPRGSHPYGVDGTPNVVDADRPGIGLRGDRGDRGRGLILRRLFGLFRVVGAEQGGDEALPAGGDEESVIDAGLVLTAIGYRGRPVPGLPFDDEKGTVANVAGRVVENGEAIPGLYVTGWIKRGPTGFIGTNKTDSGETVANLLADAEAGALPRPGTAPVPA